MRLLSANCINLIAKGHSLRDFLLTVFIGYLIPKSPVYG